MSVRQWRWQQFASALVLGIFGLVACSDEPASAGIIPARKGKVVRCASLVAVAYSSKDIQRGAGDRLWSYVETPCSLTFGYYKTCKSFSLIDIFVVENVSQEILSVVLPYRIIHSYRGTPPFDIEVAFRDGCGFSAFIDDISYTVKIFCDSNVGRIPLRNFLFRTVPYMNSKNGQLWWEGESNLIRRGIRLASTFLSSASGLSQSRYAQDDSGNSSSCSYCIK
ncbi:MAG: hypothetical protein ACRYF2_04040 [Janthinobacterium lividum]